MPPTFNPEINSMWSLRVLSGDFAGKSFTLKNGRNSIGRAPNCDIQIPSGGISKEHAFIEIIADKIILTDTNSRNGTFLNGVAIRSQKVQPGDRIALYDIICEVVPAEAPSRRSPSTKVRQHPSTAAHSGVQAAALAYQGNLAYSQDYNQQAMSANEPASAEIEPKKDLLSYLKKYLDEVVMPSVYKLPSGWNLKTC
jgi:predicted component of type VI protein secretion system